MSASASSSSAAEENKQEARPIMHCKGVNDLDKVVLHEVRGSSAEVLVCHSRSICTC
jgi:glucose-6-phosphate 1-epimerase